MELVILIGLQASGKTSFRRSRFANTHAAVSKDDFRNNPQPARRQRQLIEDHLSAGQSVIVDNTNATVEARRDLIDLGRQFGARVVGYYFDPSPAASLKRNELRTGKQRVPNVAIYATRKRLVPPSPSEGFDQLFLVRTDEHFHFHIEPLDEN